MYTPLDLCYLMRIVALWKNEETIASIVHILHTEGWKMMKKTIRRYKKD